jgi:hypothetical protein
MSGLQNVRFQNVWFQNVWFQNVHEIKATIRPVFKFEGGIYFCLDFVQEFGLGLGRKQNALLHYIILCRTVVQVKLYALSCVINLNDSDSKFIDSATLSVTNI